MCTKQNQPFSRPNNIVLVSGLSTSGKTFAINQLMSHGIVKSAGFKPFDTGDQKLRQEEQESDGEILQHHASVVGHVTLFNPYLTYTSYPFEYSMMLEEQKIRWQVVQERLQTLSELCDILWVEALDQWFAPLAENRNFIDWACSISDKACYLIHPQSNNWSQNLSELDRMKQHFPKAAVLMNHKEKNQNEHWWNYCKQKIITQYDLPVLGEIPWQNTLATTKEAREKPANPQVEKTWIFDLIRFFTEHQNAK